VAYSAIIDATRLSSAHRQGLRGRGLTDDRINLFEYRTLPLEGRAKIASTVISWHGEYVCAGVPGFIQRQGKRGHYWTLAGSPGMLIPVRDLDGRIVGLKIRSDAPTNSDNRYMYLSSSKYGGPGVESACHVPVFKGDTSTIRITEGELKADISIA